MEARFLFLILSISVGGLSLNQGDDIMPHNLSTESGDRRNLEQLVTLTDHRRVARGINPFLKLSSKMQDLVGKKPGLKQKMDKISGKLKVGWQKLNESVTEDNMKNIQGVADSLINNWDKLVGDNPKDIAKAVCEVVGAVAAFIPPPAGLIISTAMGLVSSILGMGGPKEKSMAEVMQEVVSKELKAHYLEDMRGDIDGAASALEINQAFLNGYVDGKLTDRDFQFMLRQFDLLTHMQLRGKLNYMIKKLAKSRKVDDAKDAIDMIERYVTLTSMVEVLMHTMKSILDEDDQTQLSSHNLALVIKAAKDQSRGHLEFLRKPDIDNGITVALYNPFAHENVERILDSFQLEMPEIPLHRSCYLTNKNTSFDVCMDREANGTLQLVSSKEGCQTRATFIIAKYSSWYSLQANIEDKPSQRVYVRRWPETDRYFADNGKASVSYFAIYPFPGGNFYMLVDPRNPEDPLWMNEKGHIVNSPPKGNEWPGKFPGYVWYLDCQ